MGTESVGGVGGGADPAPSVGSVGSPGGGAAPLAVWEFVPEGCGGFAGLTVGVDHGSGPSVGAVSVVGPGHSYSFITPSPEIEATDDLMRRLRQKYECELLGVVPGVGLPKGVEVVPGGVTAGEVRSMAVNTPRSVLRTGPRSPDLAWMDSYEVVCVPCPTLEAVFGPDEPGFWWVHGTDWVESNDKWEEWASRCRLESQGSAAEQEALMRRVNAMLLESGASWEGSESAAGVTPCHPFCDETPTLAALERSLAGIGGHFPALWCGDVPLLGGWRASWVWDDWRAAVDGGSGVRETIADMVAFKFLDVPSAAWCPAPSIGAQLGSLGGPWPVTDGGWLEQSLWLTAWDRELVRGVRDARGCDLLAWMVPGAATIPAWAREYDKAFREWLLNPPRYEFGGYRVDRLGGGV